MHLRSAAFQEHQPLPARHTCDGDDLSPPLEWEGAPEGTRSFAVLCEDPDAPGGVFVHWAAFDIPAHVKALPEGVPPDEPGLRQAVNDFGQPGYRGPCPPRGRGPHRYRFRVLALARGHLPLAADCTGRGVEREARRVLLGEAVLTAPYGRP